MDDFFSSEEELFDLAVIYKRVPKRRFLEYVNFASFFYEREPSSNGGSVQIKQLSGVLQILLTNQKYRAAQQLVEEGAAMSLADPDDRYPLHYALEDIPTLQCMLRSAQIHELFDTLDPEEVDQLIESAQQCANGSEQILRDFLATLKDENVTMESAC